MADAGVNGPGTDIVPAKRGVHAAIGGGTQGGCVSPQNESLAKSSRSCTGTSIWSPRTATATTGMETVVQQTHPEQSVPQCEVWTCGDLPS